PVLRRRLGVRARLRGLGALRALPARLAALERLAPPIEPGGRQVVPETTEADGPPRRRVAVLTGCVQGVFFSAVNAATVRVLAAEGCHVTSPAGQGCCGALSRPAGRQARAR